MNNIGQDAIWYAFSLLSPVHFSSLVIMTGVMARTLRYEYEALKGGEVIQHSLGRVADRVTRTPSE